MQGREWPGARCSRSQPLIRCVCLARRFIACYGIKCWRHSGARLLAARASAPAALDWPVAIRTAGGARDVAHERRTHRAAAEARRAEAASHIVAARVQAAVGRLTAQASILRHRGPDQRMRAIRQAPPRQNNHCADSKCLRAGSAPGPAVRRSERGHAPAHSQRLQGRAPRRSARIGRCAHRMPHSPLRTLPRQLPQHLAAVRARLCARRRGAQRAGRVDALAARLGECGTAISSTKLLLCRQLADSAPLLPVQL